jgi:hypothetical protein
MKRSLLPVWAVVASATMCVALLAGAFLAWRSIPTINEMMPANMLPIQVSIDAPLSRAAYPHDAFVSVLVTARSQAPVSDVELWVDSLKVGTRGPSPAQDPQDFSVQFDWIAGSIGEHTLVARARSGEQLANSLAVHVTVYESTGIIVEPPVREGDTLAALAEREGVDLGTAASENPGIDPNAPLPTDARVRLPVSPLFDPMQSPQSNPPPGPYDDSNAQRSGLPLLLGKNLGFSSEPPAAPQLTVTPDQCEVTLYVTDPATNELGFFVYRNAWHSQEWTRIATLAAHSGSNAMTYVDQPGYGVIQYYVASYNATGIEAPSNFSSAEITNTGCESGTAAGGDDQEDNLIYLDQSLQVAYFYISINGSPWTRYPQDIHDFLSLPFAKIDLNQVVSEMAGSQMPLSLRVDLEVWGWLGGELHNFGGYWTEITNTTLSACNLGSGCYGDVAGNSRLTELVVPADEGTNHSREFYWATGVKDATHVIYEISTEPLSGPYVPKHPGQIEVDWLEGTQSGAFVLDFDLIVNYWKSEMGEQAAPTSPSAERKVLDLPGNWPFGNLDSGFWLEHLGSVKKLISVLDWPVTLYVRVIPYRGVQVAEAPSNTVVIHYQKVGPVPEIQIMEHLPEMFTLELVDFSGYYDAPPEWWGCMIVQGVDEEMYQNELAAVQQAEAGTLYEGSGQFVLETTRTFFINHVGDQLCPGAYVGEDQSVWEWILSQAEAFVNMVHAALNEIWSTAAQSLGMAITELGIYDCSQKCQDNIKAALQTAWTAVTHLPPNIPNASELESMGTTYLVKSALAEAGIPCEIGCDEAIAAAAKELQRADWAWKKVQVCNNAGFAQNHGKSPMCLPAWVDAEPEPLGFDSPATATFRVTRAPGGAGTYPPDGYVVNVQVFAYLKEKWKEGVGYSQQPNPPLYKSEKSKMVPYVNPGESLVIAVPFTDVSFGAATASYDYAVVIVRADLLCLEAPFGIVQAGAKLVPCGNNLAYMWWKTGGNPQGMFIAPEGP